MTSESNLRKLRHTAADGLSLRSLVSALFLLLGVLIGYLVSERFAVPEDELLSYFHDCHSRLSGSSRNTEIVIRTFLCYYRAGVAAFLLGFSSFGVVGLPLLFAAQGFVLSYSLFSFAEALGRGGFLFLPALFAIRMLFVLPCTFLLGVAAMERSWALLSLMGGRRVQPVPAGWYRFAVCCVCLFLGCMLELWLVPLFLRGAA